MLSLHTQGLGKAYKVHRRPIDSLKEALLRRSLSEPVWAVQDVDLDLEAGGSIGIIGENGAGKSTLLRLLAGVTRPSCGVVTHVGRVGTMLQLGAGFHPDLPGTENVRIGCAVMGLSPRETDALLPAIIDFAELGDFIHRPLRTYSSGMTLRLGFAVAVAQRPDLLVVDEHLSVGDLHFRYKCLRRIAELRESGCALVLCSHDFHSVRETCDRTLWLHQGRPRMLADTASVLAAYESHVRNRDGAGSAALPAAVVDRHPSDNWISLVKLNGDERDCVIDHGGRMEVAIQAHLTPTAWRDGVQVGLLIMRNDAVWCYGVSTKTDAVRDPFAPIAADVYGVRFIVDALPLLAGHYSLTVAVLDARSAMAYHHVEKRCPFEVRQSCLDLGLVRLDHRWERGA